MLGDATLASAMASALLEQGVYVVGFSYPVVPRGQARIRVQISAAHTREMLDTAIGAFRCARHRLALRARQGPPRVGARGHVPRPVPLRLRLTRVSAGRAREAGRPAIEWQLLRA